MERLEPPRFPRVTRVDDLQGRAFLAVVVEHGDEGEHSIVANIASAQMAHCGRFMFGTASRSERIAMVTGMWQAMRPDAFDGLFAAIMGEVALRGLGPAGAAAAPGAVRTGCATCPRRQAGLCPAAPVATGAGGTRIA